jgi:hypothetical protein
VAWKRFLNEAREIAQATWAQVARFFAYAWMLWRARTLRRSLNDAQLAFGEKVYTAGLGPHELRTEIAALDEQASRIETGKARPQANARQRQVLLLKLADTLLSQDAADPGVVEVHHKAVAAQTAVKEHENLLREKRATLFPGEPQRKRRVAIGSGMVAVFLILLVGVLFLRGGRSQGPDVRGLVDALKASDASTRNEAAQVLGRIGPKAKQAVPQLLKALDDEVIPVRISAASALAHVSLDHVTNAVTALNLIVRDRESSHRLAAANALGEIGGEAKPAAAHVADLVVVSTGADRDAAVTALKKIDPELAKDALEQARKRDEAWGAVLGKGSEGSKPDGFERREGGTPGSNENESEPKAKPSEPSIADFPITLAQIKKELGPADTGDEYVLDYKDKLNVRASAALNHIELMIKSDAAGLALASKLFKSHLFTKEEGATLSDLLKKKEGEKEVVRFKVTVKESIVVNGMLLMTISLAEANKEAITAVEKIGGVVRYDEGDPKKVVSVGLQGARVTAADLERLAALPSLKTLILKRATFPTSALKVVGKLKSLEYLVLMDTSLGDDALKHLEGLTGLKTLDLGLNPMLTDAGMASLGKLKQLESLNLAGSKVTDDGLAGLEGLKKLKDLNLAGTRVTRKGVEKLELAIPDIGIISTAR